MAIVSFKNEHRFLSNFWPCPVKFEGRVYATVEHAYQAAKTTDDAERVKIQDCKTPGRAKARGKKIILRPDWLEVRVTLMLDFNLKKFRRGSDLAQLLLDTGGETLVEGNTWGDTFWGVCDGEGDNILGEILMIIRKVLSND